MRKNIAVILAGGVGSRVGLDMPKQFLKVAGKTVIEHTVNAFQSNSGIHEIAIVVHPTYVGTVETLVLSNKWDKVKKLLKGGAERHQSSLAAIRAYRDDSSNNLIFHDAVRPLVSQRIIDDVVHALDDYDAVDTAIPTADTIVAVSEGSRHIASIPDRRYLLRGQTPQAFRIDTIRCAYEKALLDPGFRATDDCGIVVKYLPGVRVAVVDGEESNMKLTHAEDIYLLDKLFQLRSQAFKRSISLEALKGTVLVVFGGTSGIGESISEMAVEYGGTACPLSRSLNGVDVRDRASIEKALCDIHRLKGRVDYIVNCAAIMSREPLSGMSPDAMREVVDTNYMGMINTSVASIRYLSETSGQLLHFTSSSYTRGRAFYSLYSSTKAAVVNFVQAVAQEWESLGIRVNCINPERTRTPMREKHFGIEPDGTLLEPSKVAEVSIQTLLSPFTGQVVDVKVNNCSLE